MASLFRPWVTRWESPDGKRCRSTDPGARQRKTRCKVWYGKGVPGQKKAVPLATDRRVAQAKLAELVLAAERGQAGLAPAESQRKTLPELVEQWRGVLASGGLPDRDVTQKANRVKRLVEGCGWTWPADVNPDQARTWLARLTFNRTRDKGGEGGLERPVGAQTRNFYLEHTRAFCGWLIEKRLLGQDPLRKVGKAPVAADLRHARRPFTLDELVRLLDAARQSTHRTVRMTGLDRWHLYQLACAVGFRRGELASLTPAHFLLDEDPPCLLLPGRRDKRRKGARQPLPRDVADLFRVYLADRPEAAPIWPRAVGQRAVHALRHDLAIAGIPYCLDTPDGPVYADFHSLRHTYISRLEAAGLSLREAMQLARHSDPRLTLARYGKKAFSELAEKVQALGLPADQGPTVAESLLAWLLTLAGVVLVAPVVAPPAGASGGNQGRPGAKTKQDRVA